MHADLLHGEDREDFLARFRREAQSAGRCAHANIVAIYDFAMHEGNPFLAMEYIAGVGLGDALRHAGRFPPAEAVAITGQLLDALAAAHAMGIVHRDIKPANILLLEDGQVKVTDFGVARADMSDLTMDGRVVGTPAYMSPEQCRGETVDARSDLFSAGAVLYELLTGVRAFPGRQATAVSYMLLTAEPRDPHEFVADMPAALAAALRRAMAKDRDERFSSAREMADALRRSISGARPADVTPAVDRTTIPETSAFDDIALDTIERQLTRLIGPIARRVVRDAARRHDTLETLCEAVASTIGTDADRARFLVDVRGGSAVRTGGSAEMSAVGKPTVARQASPATGPAPRSVLTADQIERASQALTRILGPIAKVLVRRAVPRTGLGDGVVERAWRHTSIARMTGQLSLRRRLGG